MDPVSGLSRIMETLRRQVSGEQRIEKRRGAKTPHAASARGHSDVGQLEQRIAERIKALDPDDPRHVETSVQIFLESVLAWEFGEEILRDPQLAELVSKLQNDLLNEPPLSTNFNQLLNQLRTR